MERRKEEYSILVYNMSLDSSLSENEKKCWCFEQACFISVGKCEGKYSCFEGIGIFNQRLKRKDVSFYLGCQCRGSQHNSSLCTLKGVVHNAVVE